MCDPDWLDKQAIVETIQHVDAVTCSSEVLTEFVQQLTDKPVVFVPDRFDLEYIPEMPKTHKGKAKKIIWFGYKQNAELLLGAVDYLKRNKYELTIMANEDPFIKDIEYEFVKYDEANFYNILQQHDICLLPKGIRPVDRFKSDNKTQKARLAGIPVATTADELEACIDADKRNEIAKLWYNKAKSQADCRQSVAQMQELIKELQNAKAK